MDKRIARLMLLILGVCLIIPAFPSLRKWTSQLNIEPPIEDITWNRNYSWWGYGALRKWQPVPYFEATTSSGRKITNTSPKGRFFIYLVDPDLPSVCLDVECGGNAQILERLGAHLIGISDPKIARIFGIENGESQLQLVRVPAFAERFIKINHLHKAKTLETSLAVVADERGIIRGIFRNVDVNGADLIDIIKKSGIPIEYIQ